MNPPTERPATRAKNATQRPGKVLQTRKRRTKAEMERDRALQQERKQTEKTRKNKGIASVAQLEDRMAINEANIESAHPRSRQDLHQAAMNQRIEQKFDDGIEPNPGKRLTRKAGTAQPGAVIQDSLKTGVKGATEKGKRAGTGETSMGHSEMIVDGLDSHMDVSCVKEYLPIKAGRDIKKAPSRKDKEERDLRSSGPDYQREGPNVRVEMHMDLRGRQQTSTRHKEALTVQQSDGSDSEPMTLDDNLTPKNNRSGLKRSYAIADIPVVQTQRGQDDVSSEDDGYEPPSERELGITEPDNHHADNYSDDDPTPKKKQKVERVPVRKAVGASREEPEFCRERSKVGVMKASNEFTTSTKTSKTSSGIIKTWASNVDNKTWVAPSSVRTASTTTAVRSTARTTSSSNAVVVPTKHVATKEIKSKDMDHDFWDENEAAEREAALSSPIKGKQRLSSAAIVKIEHTPPPPKRTNARKTNADLPPGTLDNSLWRRSFIPTYVQYLASRKVEDAWAVVDDDAISLLQKIWDYIYGARVPHIVSASSSVFFVADQRMCEWRSGFASAALTILHALFEDNDINTDEERQAFAEDALNGYSFIYRDVGENQGVTKRKGMFGGALVVRTFAAHYSTIRGAAHVPSIGNPSGPAVALALSASGAERALMLWDKGFISCETVADHRARKRSSPIIKTVNKATGKSSTKMTDFNQANWSAPTNSYLASIKGLSDSKFNVIIKAAMAIAKATQPAEAPSSMGSNNDPADERACLASDDSDGD